MPMFLCALINGSLPHAPPVAIGHALALAHLHALGPIACLGVRLRQSAFSSRWSAPETCKAQRHLVAAWNTDARVVHWYRCFRGAGVSWLRSMLFPTLGRSKCNDSLGNSFAMVDVKLRSLARDLRARAREILARAETMYDTDFQETMREVAARHEKLAQRIEQGSSAAEM